MRSFSLMLLALVPLAAHAQPSDPPKSLAYTLIVKPAAEEAGPVRHPLQASFRERTHGNAAIYYHRAIGHRRNISKEVLQYEEDFDKMLEKSQRELRWEKIETYLQAQKNVFRELQEAAKCSLCDWQLEDRINADGIGMLMEEIQSCRALATALKYRIRSSLTQDKIDEAMRAVQIGMTLGRHVGEGPTLISHLVGVAIESIFLNELTQVMQSPRAPNFYRALALLPSPFFRNEAMIEGEQRMVEATLGIRNVMDRTISHDEAIQVLINFADLEKQRGEGGGAKKANEDDAFKAQAMVALMLPKARPSMTKYGFTAEQVKNFSDAQIVVIDLVRRFRGRHEEAMLPMRLPYPEALAMTKALDKKYPDDKVDRFDMVEIMNRLLLPAVGRVRNADIRLDRQIAMLRTIEAIRLYAAENKGKLPEKLKAAAELVSIPTDPATAKPFVYRADGKKFTLTAPPFDGAPPSVANTVEYTVTIER